MAEGRDCSKRKWWLDSPDDEGSLLLRVPAEAFRNTAQVVAAMNRPYVPPPPPPPSSPGTMAAQCKRKIDWLHLLAVKSEEPKIVTPSHKPPRRSFLNDDPTLIVGHFETSYIDIVSKSPNSPGPKAEEPMIVTPSRKRPNTSVLSDDAASNTGGKVKRLKLSYIAMDVSHKSSEGPSSPGPSVEEPINDTSPLLKLPSSTGGIPSTPIP